MEAAYRAFAGAPVGPVPAVCFCPVCFDGDEALARALVDTPLREIPKDLLTCYTRSAHGWHDEMRYFLPRYLDLIARGDAPCDTLDEHVLSRMAETPWRAAWPAAEREAVEGFFDAHLRALAARGPPEEGRWGGGDDAAAYWRSPLREALGMIANAGGDVGRALRVLDEARDPATDLHLAALVNETGHRLGRGRLGWGGAMRDRAAEARIAAWLRGPAMARRVEAGFFAATDDRARETFSVASTALGPPPREDGQTGAASG